jgi:hypothetical protein
MGSLLTRSFGVQPSGAGGTWTRKDHLKAAGVDAVLVVALVAAIAIEADLRGGKIGAIGGTAAVVVLFPFAALCLRLIFAAIGKK